MGRQSWPNFPLYDQNGYLWAWYPMWLRDMGTAWQENDRTVQQVQLVVEPIKNWKTFVQFNYQTTQNYSKEYENPYFVAYDANENPFAYNANRSNSTTGFINEWQEKTNLWDFNAYTEYSLKVLEDHNVKVMAGMQSQEAYIFRNDHRKFGIMFRDVPEMSLTSGFNATNSTTPAAPWVNGSEDKYATMGFFGRLNYDYKGKYLFEFNLRYDGTSRFRPGHNWTISPSAAVAWNMMQEDFMKPLEEYLTQLKPRVSYGILSNQNTRNYYPTYQTMELGGANSGWLVNGVSVNTAWGPNRLENPYMSWEKVKSFNVGLDIAALKNRLTSTLEIFTRDNENMLGPAEARPNILGTNVPMENNTSLRDKGFELSLGWRDRIKSLGLTYSARFNVQDSRTLITKFPNPTNTLSWRGSGSNARDNKGQLNSYIQGRYTGEIWGFTTIGMAKTQEEMDAHLATLPNGGQGALNGNGKWLSGDMMYKDLNGDGKITRGNSTDDPGDVSVIGNSTPRYRFGLDLNAAWKGFDIRCFLQGTAKRDYYTNTSYMWGAANGMWWSLALKPHADYFRDDPNHPLGENLNAYYPRPRFGNDANQMVQTAYLQDASYMRIKNLQLGYTIPNSLTSKAYVQSVRLYFSADNLATFTKLNKLFDPETIGNATGSGASYPLSRVLSFGVNVNL